MRNTAAARRFAIPIALASVVGLLFGSRFLFGLRLLSRVMAPFALRVFHQSGPSASTAALCFSSSALHFREPRRIVLMMPGRWSSRSSIARLTVRTSAKRHPPKSSSPPNGARSWRWGHVQPPEHGLRPLDDRIRPGQRGKHVRAVENTVRRGGDSGDVERGQKQIAADHGGGASRSGGNSSRPARDSGNADAPFVQVPFASSQTAAGTATGDFTPSPSGHCLT